MGAVVAGYLGAGAHAQPPAARRGLNGDPLARSSSRRSIAAGWGIATYLLNQDRAFEGAVGQLEGVPWAVPILLTVVGLHLLITAADGAGRVRHRRQRRGGAARGHQRHMGQDVVLHHDRPRGLPRGHGAASQLNSVSPQTGGNDTLLRAVGAAAIGGVTLFGGRGKLIYPVIGGLVVATIDNGLGLMGTVAGIDFTQSGPKFIVQGLVLLLAASVDAISRPRRARDGARPLGPPDSQDHHHRRRGGARGLGDAESRPWPAATPRRPGVRRAARGAAGLEGYDAMLRRPRHRRRLHLPAQRHAPRLDDARAGRRQARAVREAVHAAGRRGRGGVRRAEAFGLLLSEAFMWRHNPQTRLLRTR